MVCRNGNAFELATLTSYMTLLATVLPNSLDYFLRRFFASLQRAKRDKAQTAARAFYKFSSFSVRLALFCVLFCLCAYIRGVPTLKRSYHTSADCRIITISRMVLRIISSIFLFSLYSSEENLIISVRVI